MATFWIAILFIVGFLIQVQGSEKFEGNEFIPGLIHQALGNLAFIICLYWKFGFLNGMFLWIATNMIVTVVAFASETKGSLDRIVLATTFVFALFLLFF